jgi:hypothetical protein
MPIIRDDLLDKVEAEELYLSCQWQPEALNAVLAEFFDNRQILSIVSH